VVLVDGACAIIISLLEYMATCTCNSNARQMSKQIKRLTPLKGKGRKGWEIRERGTKSQKGGEGRRECNGGGGPRALARMGGLYLDICTGALRVPSFAIADEAGLTYLARAGLKIQSAPVPSAHPQAEPR